MEIAPRQPRPHPRGRRARQARAVLCSSGIAFTSLFGFLTLQLQTGQDPALASHSTAGSSTSSKTASQTSASAESSLFPATQSSAPTNSVSSARLTTSAS